MRTSMTRPLPRPSASTVEDIEREDNQTGFEEDSLTAFHTLVRQLTADGDRRAARAGRRVRRTLAEMKKAEMEEVDEQG